MNAQKLIDEVYLYAKVDIENIQTILQSKDFDDAEQSRHESSFGHEEYASLRVSAACINQGLGCLNAVEVPVELRDQEFEDQARRWAAIAD